METNTVKDKKSNQDIYDSIKRERKLPYYNDPEYLGEHASNWAIFITKALKKNNSKFQTQNFETINKISTHQIRRYYSEFKSIERSIDSYNNDKIKEEWLNIYHRIKLLAAKAKYDSKRQMNSLPWEFELFISLCVKSIPSDCEKGIQSFKNICLFFEAIVGYSSQYTKS